MKQRIITALLLMLITLPCVILGGNLFIILCFIASMISIYELLDILKLNQVWINLIIYLFGFYTIFLDKSLFFVSSKIIMLFIVILFIISMFYSELTISKINFTAGFLTFVCIALHCILNVRLQFGINSLLFIALATYGSDTGAYFVGVKFGKHPLIPRLSPKKTIEGSIGGILLGTLLSSLFAYFYQLPTNLFESIILGFILTITAQIGDLTFSSVKRHVNIKDFSNLLPGHGGILDRLDSLLFNSLIFALFLSFFII